MKIFQLILLAFLLGYSNNFAQLQSISFNADYSSALSTRLQITEGDAVGGGVKIKFLIAENMAINIHAGYKLYSLSEPDVLNNWDWVFWTDRYYSKIVSDLAADSNLAVTISPVQKMDLIPISVSFSYDIIPFDKLEITPTIGGGLYIYTRRMFAVETWSKYYPDADYTLTYEYRNFAPNKKGSPFFVNGNLNIQYKLYETLGFFTNVQYSYVIPTEGSLGYDDFPFNSELSIALGLAIFY
ncbi:MAG: hypothetical protein MUF28_12280 [Ignavibacterium sp.]|nr:hypothetical protein [Ignavibacterium sp.]